MFFLGLFILILMAEGCFNGLNKGLPSWIHTQNFGLVELLYRAMRIIAPCFFARILVSWIYPFIGIVLYLLAFGIKKLTWHLAYGDYLD